MTSQSPDLPDWLARTRIHAPQARMDVIARPFLHAGLLECIHSHTLTLISAPAGYGKTTLMAGIGDHAQASTFPAPAGQPARFASALAWLALEEEDNDPTRFLQLLVASLRCLHPACGAHALGLLRDLPNPAAQTRQITSALINDIVGTMTSPFVLAIDDLHLIREPAIFLALDYLAAHCPAMMRIVIGTRQDPPLALARLRARGQLAELRQAELRFTPAEMALFLNTVQNLALTPADLASLEALSEGWPAGLRLLAASLDHILPAERSAFIADLARSDHYIFDFLAAEVLDRQAPDIRAFLLETSILNELTPARCQALTGRADAGDILEKLYRRNLFLIVLPSPISHLPSRIYRYHALFAGFLRQRLALEMPERVRELHRRAAESQTDPQRAIGHYLAAEMWEQAAQAIEDVGGQLLRQGLLDTLTGWIHALPAPARERRPRLVYLLGSCAWEKGDLDTAYAFLEDALRGFEAAGDEMEQGEALTDLANCAMLRADVERSAVLFDRALAHPLSPQRRVQSLMGRAGLGFFRNDWAQATTDFAAATAVMEESADPEILRLLLIRLNAGYTALPGGKERMDRILGQARVHFGDQISPLRVIIEELTALLHIWRGQLHEAIGAGEKTLAFKERLGGSYPFVGVDAATIVVDSYTALGNYAAAERYVGRLFEGVKHTALVEQMRVASLFVVARCYWLQGRLDQVRPLYAQICAAENPHELPMDAGFRARLRGMLAMSEGRYTEAERALRQAVSIEQQEHFSALFGSGCVLLAHFYATRGRPDQALAELAPILAESEQRGMLCFIVLNGAAAAPLLRLAVERDVHADYAARLLAALGHGDDPHSLRVPDTGEILTAREVEVLRLIAAGASNRQIVARLCISEQTVKSHVSHILGKLNVASRGQAAARARDLL